MHLIADILELKLYGVFDRGVPNKERIVLRAWGNSAVTTADFMLCAGWAGPQPNTAWPLGDVFWLPTMDLQPNQWLFCYTGTGKRETWAISNEVIIGEYMNRSTVIFDNPNLTPMLFRLSGVTVARSPDWVLEPTAVKQGQLT